MKILLFFILSISLASAHECEEDLKTFCSTQEAKLECLISNKEKLSTKCIQEFKRVSEILKSTGSRGSGGLSSFSGVMGGMGLVPPKKKIINYSGAIAPEDSPTEIQQHKLTIASPLWTKGKESFAMSLNAGKIAFKDNKFWNQQETNTPRELNRLEVGTQYSRSLEDSRLFGMRASVGSASDKIFYGWEEVTFSLNATYLKPAKTEGDYWIYTAFMSNNNPLLNYLPIPGFIYLKKTENFTGMFGLPFLSLQWTPAKPVILSTSFFITNFNAEAAYVIKDGLQVFTGFAISQQTFLREERSNIRNRLFFNEKKAYVGVKTFLPGGIAADIQAGRTFDRKLVEGKRFDDKILSADFGKSWYSAVNFVLAY